jgi:hypothetical protein
MKIAITTIAVVLVGCGAWLYDDTPRNADIIVTYHGKEEYLAKKAKPVPKCTCECPLHKKNGGKKMRILK